MEIILGTRLKELREEKKLTQRQLANIFNLNSVTYLHYEKDQRVPPLSLIVKFADYYGVTVDYLLGRCDY